MPTGFLLLWAAMLVVWLPAVTPGRGWPALRLWQLLFVGAVASAMADGIVRWPALLPLAAVWAVAAAVQRAEARGRSAGWWITAAVLAGVGLSAHLFPGFSPHVVAVDLKLSAASAPITVHANFDKGAAGLLLLAYCCRRVTRASEWPAVLGRGLLWGLATAAVVVGLVAATGAVHADPKWPEIALPWMAINLFLTCVLEEAVFRGILQERLEQRWAGRARWLPLLVVSLAFGLVHAGGGPLLIAAAALAGVGYGLAYASTGRIESAVLAHFLLNAIHFLGFTYPYAVS